MRDVRTTALILLFSVTASYACRWRQMGSIYAVQFNGPPLADDLARFEDYPTMNTFRGIAAPARIDSAAYGRMFRTRLRQGAREGPNFAGAFTLVMWGCGSSCQYVAVVDARTGRLSQQTLLTAMGVEYRVDSRLLIADPVRPENPYRSQCASCGTPAGYIWDGSRFMPVGKGPHPHLSGDRPWRTP